jgi:hypothetical protein
VTTFACKQEPTYVLALYAATFHKNLHTDKQPAIPDLADLCTYRQGLLEQRLRIANWLRLAADCVKPLLQEDLANTQAQITRIEPQIDALTEQQEEAAVLRQVKGVGPRLGAWGFIGVFA